MATRTGMLNIFEYICEPVSKLIKGLRREIYTKEMFYKKLITKIEAVKKSLRKSNFSSESIITKRKRIQQEYKVKEELCVSDKVYAGVVEFGGIESLFVESIEEDMQAVLFCKKEMSKYEINMLKYLMEKIKLNASNKYIVALTEGKEPIQRLCEINGVVFKRVGRDNLQSIQQYVEDKEIMEKKILPKMQHYLANYDEIKRKVVEKCRGSYIFNDQNKLSNFMDYLKYFSDIIDEPDKNE